MLPRLLPNLLFIGLASCGSSDRAANQIKGERPLENATVTKLRLTSEAFQGGQPIPTQYTCDGADQSPQLSWGEPPQGTRSFALVVDDPDAPSGTFRHWGAYDIPAPSRSIAAGQSAGIEVDNDKGTKGYTGPCPPKGQGPHHYHFKLFALDVDHLGIGPKAKVADVERAASEHAIAQGELIGTFERR